MTSTIWTLEEIRDSIADEMHHANAKRLDYASEVELEAMKRWHEGVVAAQARNEELVEALQQAFEVIGPGPTNTWGQEQAAYESINAALSGQPSPPREENERLEKIVTWVEDKLKAGGWYEDDPERPRIQRLQGAMHVATQRHASYELACDEIGRLKAQRDELLKDMEAIQRIANLGTKSISAKMTAIYRVARAALPSAEKGDEKVHPPPDAPSMASRACGRPMDDADEHPLDRRGPAPPNLDDHPDPDSMRGGHDDY